LFIGPLLFIVFHWKAAMTQFAIQFGDRFTKRVA